MVINDIKIHYVDSIRIALARENKLQKIFDCVYYLNYV